MTKKQNISTGSSITTLTTSSLWVHTLTPPMSGSLSCAKQNPTGKIIHYIILLVVIKLAHLSNTLFIFKRWTNRANISRTITQVANILPMIEAGDATCHRSQHRMEQIAWTQFTEICPHLYRRHHHILMKPLAICSRLRPGVIPTGKQRSHFIAFQIVSPCTKILAHYISRLELSTTQAKVGVIRSLEFPCSLRDLKVDLCFFEYHRSFVTR